MASDALQNALRPLGTALLQRPQSTSSPASRDGDYEECLALSRVGLTQPYAELWAIPNRQPKMAQAAPSQHLTKYLALQQTAAMRLCRQHLVLRSWCFCTLL